MYNPSKQILHNYYCQIVAHEVCYADFLRFGLFISHGDGTQFFKQNYICMKLRFFNHYWLGWQLILFQCHHCLIIEQ
jgi:hypothetical protein